MKAKIKYSRCTFIFGFHKENRIVGAKSIKKKAKQIKKKLKLIQTDKIK